MNKPSGAGRGVLYLTISKFYFILAGYAIFFGLPRLLGEELFGLFAIINSIVAILNAALVYGTIQMVSKFVSQEEEHGGAVLKSALKLQVAVGGSIFAAYYFSAPLIARCHNDPDLVPFLRLSSLIVICYAFYAIYMGYINGRKKFGLQATLDMSYSTLKMLFMLSLAAVGFGAAGAIGGFAIAAFVLLVIAVIVCGGRQAGGFVRTIELFRFEAFIIVFTLITNLLLQTDLQLIKMRPPQALVGVSSYTLVAHYAAAQRLAFIPYQAIIAITFVLFPYVSRLTFIDDRARLVEYIREALRYSLIILIGIGVLFATNSEGIIRLIFPSGYEAAAPALSLLVFGIVFFSILYINATIISGSGKPAHSFLLAFGTWVIDAILNYNLIPRYGMMGAAFSTTTAMLCGLAGSALYVRLKFGTYLPLVSALRICAAGAAVGAISLMLPCAGLAILAKLAVLSLAYVTFLFLLRELDGDDIARIRTTLLGR